MKQLISYNYMEKNNKAMLGSILIILAGCFWGSMGIFVRRLGAYGFSSDPVSGSNIKSETAGSEGLIRIKLN